MGNKLKPPVTPFLPPPRRSISSMVRQMGGTSFQARNLSRGTAIWEEMVRKDAFIFFGLAGAMVPAGMRSMVAYLIQSGLINCLVSTGSNLFHDLHETLGYPHFQGSPGSDEELHSAGINRIYDTFLPEAEVETGEEFIARFAVRLPQDRAYPTREFLDLLGQDLASQGKEEGILTAAYRARVPIFSPALVDSVFGTALALARVKQGCRLALDLAQDVVDIIQLCATHPITGVVLVGGGTPKNFIQQAVLCVSFFGKEVTGHHYAVQITTDSPQWGGLSGCTFEEARSWGKVARGARTATIYCDATIALPLMVSALAERCASLLPRKQPQAQL